MNMKRLLLTSLLMLSAAPALAGPPGIEAGDIELDLVFTPDGVGGWTQVNTAPKYGDGITFKTTVAGKHATLLNTRVTFECRQDSVLVYWAEGFPRQFWQLNVWPSGAAECKATFLLREFNKKGEFLRDRVLDEVDVLVEV